MDATFAQASRFLERLALPSFPKAHDRLLNLARAGNIVDAFRQCFPEKWTPSASGLGLHDLQPERLLALQEAAIAAVAGLFPVQEDYMDMLIHDNEPLVLHPDSCGFAWDDEWLNEIFQDPSQLLPGSDLAMFFKLLWILTTQFGEEDGQETWERMRAHFGYPCDFPHVGEHVHARTFDWDHFYDLLDACGLGDFRRAIDVSLCDTGNVFLDASPDEYGYGVVEIPDFTVANIRELQRLWAEAESWLEDYEACRARVISDPSIYTQVARLWEQACQPPHPARPRTLLELFSGDADEPTPPPLP